MELRRAFLLTAGHAILGLCGCVMFHRVPTDFQPLWTPKDGAWPAKSMAAPAGFTITPHRAYEITRKGYYRSLKHQWHLYADSQYYYVHDTFLGDSAKEAHREGLRIDGRTGQVVRGESR